MFSRDLVIWLWCSGLRGAPETWAAGDSLCRRLTQNHFVVAYAIFESNRGLSFYLSHFKWKRKAPEAWCWEDGDPHWGCGLRFSWHLPDVELSSGFGLRHCDARCYRVALMVFLWNNCRTIHPSSNYIINKKGSERNKLPFDWILGNNIALIAEGIPLSPGMMSSRGSATWWDHFKSATTCQTVETCMEHIKGNIAFQEWLGETLSVWTDRVFTSPVLLTDGQVQLSSVHRRASIRTLGFVSIRCETIRNSHPFCEVFKWNAIR